MDKTIAVIGTRGMPAVQGGVEHHCQELYPLMAQHGFRIRLYRRKPYLNKQSKQANYDHITFIDLPSTRIKGLEAMLHTLLALTHIITHRPSAVHVHNMGPAFVAPILRFWGIPVVMTYHSVNYEHTKWNRIERTLLKISEKIALRYCNRVIFVNPFRLRQMPENIKAKSIYIPNGIAEKPIPDNKIIEQHQLKKQQYVLAVGRITPEKGFEQLIKAANRCSRVQRLVIAGGFDHNNNYLKKLRQADTHDKTVFTGEINSSQLSTLYDNARLMVVPSLSEGFPLVLLEAMSHNLPIVASDIEACKIIRLPGNRYAKAGDVDDMARVLEETLQEPYKPVRYNLSAYNWEIIAKDTANLFTTLMTDTLI